MRKILYILACVVIVCIVSSCDTPNSPNFKLNRTVKVPLTVAKTYPFLGGDGALIDSTSSDFDDLFSTGQNGLVLLTKVKDIDFGDLNDAIPEISVAPTMVNARIGEISLGDFSSASPLGTASFEDVTGFSSALQKGDLVPAGSTPGATNIGLSLNYFQSATTKKEGNIRLTITNNLGFDVSQLTVSLKAGNITVSSATINSFNNGSTKNTAIVIPAHTNLHDLSVDVTAQWPSQTMDENAGNLVIKNVSGQDLVASKVTASIGAQNFTDSGTTSVDNSSFKFTQPGDFVELSQGNLSIHISNGIDVGIQHLEISFPGIRNKSTGASLVLNMSNIPPSSAGGQYSNSYDLSGYRIYADNNTLSYEVDAVTKNMQHGPGSKKSTIYESDQVQVKVDLNNLKISRAKGIVEPETVLLNDDAISNGQGTLDVFNDTEAEIVNIDGINDISKKLSGISLVNPTLTLTYKTNMGVNTTIYAAIAGTNANGQTVYLSGKPNSDYWVKSSEIPNQLEANGHTLQSSQLVKFKIDTSPDGSIIRGSTVFDKSKTNASDFFSNLPTKIRFIGIAKVNENSKEGVIVKPVKFDPSLSVDVPLNLSAGNAAYQDTVDADLSGLPGQGDTQQLTKATITFNYTNGLPLNLNLSLVMLDASGNEVTHYPLSSQSPLSIKAASVDPQTGFVEPGTKKTGKVQLSLNKHQLDVINRTQSIILKFNFSTAGHQPVKIRANDSVTLRLKLSAVITSNIN